MKRKICSSLAFILAILLVSSQTYAQDSEFFIKETSASRDLSDFTATYHGDVSNISVINFSGNYDRNIDELLNIEARLVVTNEFYQYQPDQYDFLVIFTRFPVDSGEAAAFAISYENNVQGIGKPIFDNSLIMGSERLQTTIDMTEITDWTLNPGSVQYDSTLDTLMHEMMHRWGTYVSFEDENNQISDLTLGRDSVHWNYFLNSNASVMYGALWNDLGNGHFETQSTRSSLSPLDLYLMGFKEPTAVPDFFLIENGTPGDREDLPSLIGTQVSGNRVNISINDIIAAEGERIPGVQDSQHKFNFRFILLKPYGQETNPQDIGSLVVLQREFQKRFFAETSGVGEIIYPDSEDFVSSSNPDTLDYDSTTNQSVDFQSAELFLLNNYNDTESHWEDKAATKIRDTYVALEVVRGLEQPNVESGATGWLRTQRSIANSHDDLAWLLLSDSLHPQVKNDVVNDLIQSMNDDGGWGLAADSESSVYDTALVLKALLNARGEDFAPTVETLLFIQNQFNADGGVGYTAGGKSSLASSALLLSIIFELTQNSAYEQSLIDFIVAEQNPDGGFGVGQSSAHETAMVIQALTFANDQAHAQVTQNAKEKLESMQSVDGSFEGSIYSTALALEILLNDIRPDLSIDFAQLTDDLAVAGEQVAIEYEVSNKGATLTESVTLAVMDGQQILSSDSILSVQPGQKIIGQLAFDTTALLGAVNLEFKVDQDNSIVESNEFNNTAQLALEVVAQSSTPELAIDRSSVDYNTSYFDALPFDFTTSFNVSNLSTSNITSVEVSLHRRMDEYTWHELQSHVIDIDANQNQMVNFNVQISAAEEDIEFEFMVDPENQIVEVNESNNQLTATLEKLSTIDLSISEPQISIPAPLILGQQADISFDFSNLGTQLSPGFTVKAIYHGSSDDVDLYENDLFEMLGGQQLTRQFSWVPDELGDFTLEFILDEDNEVAEVDEGNNSVSIPITVVGNSASNLQISPEDITINPLPGLTGQSLEIFATVKNNSNTDSGIFDVSFYHQLFDQPSELISTTTNNTSIPAGGEQIISVIVNDYSLAGNVTFVVEVDPMNQITEFNEGDNVAFNTLRVLNKPDAYASSGGFVLSPSIPVLDSPLAVDVEIANIGEQSLINLQAKLYAKSSIGAIEVGSSVLPLIEAGQTELASFNFTFPNDPDYTTLFIVVDENDNIDEIYESNNQAVLIIENQNQDFYVSERYFSPNGDGIKDLTNIVFNLETVDNYKIRILNQFNEEVRTYPVFENSRFGDINWDGRNNDQKIANDGEYLIMITGQNSNLQKLTSVWLDTNRSTVGESLLYDDGYITNLNCSIKTIGGFDAENAATYSLDGQFIYLKSYFPVNNGSEQKGLFALAIDGSSIKSIIPPSFTANNLVESFQVLENGHIMLKTKVLISNQQQLWYLNTNDQSFYQLDTQNLFSFNVEFNHSGYSIIGFGGQSFDHLKVSHLPNQTSEQITDLYEFGSALYKVTGGWLERSNDLNIWYRFADLQTTDIRLGDVIYGISEDNRRALIQREDEAVLYAFSSLGPTEIKAISFIDNNIYTNRLIFASDNQFIWMNNGLIEFYGTNGEAKFSVDHPFDIEYFKDRILDSYGTLDDIPVDTEFGTFFIAFDQLEQPKIDFDNISVNWLSETEFSLHFFARFTAEIDPGLVGGSSSQFELGQSFIFNQRLDYQSYPQVNQFESLYTAQSITELSSPYYLSNEDLVQKSVSYDLSVGSNRLLEDFVLLETYPSIVFPNQVKSLFLKNQNTNFETDCSEVGANGIYGIYLPKDNLTAFMELAPTAVGVEINGTLFDANLDKFEVYYADSTSPETWNLIGVDTDEKVEQLLFNWLPPVNGSYRVKLVVFDKAGNNKEVIKSIQVTRSASSITVPVVKPIYFSPNGDGVLDTVSVQYDSLQAGDVLITVSDSAGQVVRSWVRNYAVAGVSELITWDGKDNINNLLEDGEYQIKVGGFRYAVILDTEPPGYGIELQFSIDRKPSFGYDFNEPKSHIAHSFRGNTWRVNRGDYNTPNLGSPINLLSPQKLVDNTWVDMNGPAFILKPDTYFENRELYRYQRIDMAGNSGGSGTISFDEKIFPAELLKLQNQLPDQAPLVFPHNYYDTKSKSFKQYAYNPDNAARFVDWNLSNKLGFSFQSLTNETIESIRMTTSYNDENMSTISETKLVELADFDVVSTYYPEFSPSPSYFPEGAFQFTYGNNEIALYLLELDESDFPDVNVPIDTEFEVLFENNPTPETIAFKIQFKQPELPIFRSIPAGSQDQFILKENEREAYFDALDQIDYSSNNNYLWFFLDKKQLTSESWVNLSVKHTDDFVSSLRPVYTSESREYISQIFEVELQCGVNYKAEWKSFEINFDEPVITEPIKSCAFNHLQDFYLNDYCDGNTPTNDEMTFQLFGNLDSNPESDPVLLEIYWWNRGHGFELIYTDTEISDDVFLNQGNRKYATRVSIPASDYDPGRHVFYAEFSYLNKDPETKGFEMFNTPIKADFEIIAPTENQFFCGQNSGGGFAEGGASEVLLDLELSIPDGYSKPHAVNLVRFVDGVNLDEYDLLGLNGKAIYGGINKVEFDYDSYNPIEQGTTFLFESPKIYQELDLKLGKREDSAILQVETINSTGVSQCKSVEIQFDSLVRADAAVSAENFYFSPITTGLLNYASISADEPVDVVIDVYSGNIHVEEIESFSLQAGDQQELYWNGMSGGSNLSDGNYSFEIRITDACGNWILRKLSVTVDNTPPDLSFIYPLDGGNVSSLTEILFQVEEPNIAQLNLEYEYLNFWTPINFELTSSDAVTPLEYLAQWDLTELPLGTYLLRLSVTDEAGNEAVIVINVNYTQSQDLIWQFGVSERLISPNNDGVKDSTQIELGLNMHTDIDLTVVDANDVLVKQLSTTTFIAGVHIFNWDGTNDLSQIVADGSYQIKLIATSVGNPGNTVEMLLTVESDNTQPESSFTPNNSVIKGEGMLSATVTDINLDTRTATLQQLDPIGSVINIQADFSGGNVFNMDLQSLEETSHKVTTVATDLAGNEQVMAHEFKVDNTSPLIALTTPENLSIVGGEDAELLIEGRITEINLVEYKIFISKNIATPVWNELFQNSELTDDHFSHLWPINVSDGEYLVRIWVIDQAGWESEVIHEITIDTQAPELTLTSPLNASLHGQSVTFTGSVLDDNLSFYHLSYKAANETDWTLIFSGVDTVDASDIFIWDHDVLSEDYQVRLFAGDEAGLTTELIVSLEIDSTSPLAPTFLIADLLQQKDVSLNWTASTSADVVGYFIYRNNTALNETAVTNVTYLDVNIPEGEYSYWVVAVDDIGNLSEPSNVVDLLIDRTGPLVSLQQPVDAAIVNGVLDVIGTVEDVSDFNLHRLYVRPALAPAPGDLLAESFLPSLAELLAQLDTQVLVQDLQYTIRLEALDLSGNVSFIEHTVLVDNLAPGAPLNLTHQVLGQDDVRLDWQANQESDLVGYLVYRNGSIISGNGTPESGIITDITYTDVDVVDGDHFYYVAAVDLATNISDPSNTVNVNINRRAPDTFIISPSDGMRFEEPVEISADSQDDDTAHITIEYSADNVQWLPLGQVMIEPYSLVLNPQSLGLSYGQVYVRATAEDLGGQTDSSPAQISLEYTDLTAPQTIQNLQVVALGDQVQLSWDDNTELDLQGYRVLRKQLSPTLENQYSELNAALLTASDYIDTGVSDGVYSYRVVAVDDNDNISEDVQSADVPVWSLAVQQPYSPILAPLDVTIEGSSVYQGDVIASLTDTSGIQTLPLLTTQVDGHFEINAASLLTGLNSFSIYVEDQQGNQSKPSDRSIEVSPTPSVPINPASNVIGFDVTLSWQAPGAGVLGYLPYINHTPVFATERLVSGITFNSSSNNFLGSSVLDGDDQTVWRPSNSDVENGLPTFIELNFDQPKWITNTTIHWDQNYYYPGHVSVPSTYLLQYKSPVGWITQEDFTGSEVPSVTFEGMVPYLASAVRIWMPLEEYSFDNIRLREIDITQQPITDQLNLIQNLADGQYDWQVSAINQYGFESDKTPVESFNVGDVLPPEPVILSGNPQNVSSIELSWTASTSIDVAHYRLFRNNDLVFSSFDENTLVYIDENLANGDYNYHVSAVDSVGNQSTDSNIVDFSVDQQILNPPTGLTISSLPNGGSLSLSWDLHGNPDWAGYKLYRSLSGSGGFVEIIELTGTEYQDNNLNDGVAYFYYITAIDVLGNESLPSAQVSGIPNDLTAPLMPVIASPTTHGFPISVNAITTDISGTTSAGVEIDLYRNGLLNDSTFATDQFTQTQINLNQFFDDTRFNESNSRFIYYDFNTDQFTIADPENVEYTPLIGDQLREYFWNQAGNKVFAVSGFGNQSELKSFGLDGMEIETLLTGYNISRASISPDETQLLYWGDGLNPDNSTIENGLWLFTFASNVHVKIDLGQSIALYHNAIEWLPGDLIAFINFPNDIFNDGQVWVYNIQDDSAQMLPGIATSMASMTASNDGSHLYFEIDDNGNTAVVRYRLSDGQSNLLSKNGIDVFLPMVHDDVDLVFVNVDCCSKQLINIETDELLFNLDNSGYRSDGAWLNDGRIFLQSNDTVIYLIPPGYFEFNFVDLMPGLNEFYAVSRKPNGLSSQPSESIEITLNSLALADLVIESNYLQIIPSEVYPGDHVSGTILIKNNSSVDVESSHLLIELIDPNLNSRIVFPSPVEFSLAAGESIVQNIVINDLSVVGEYILRVVADYNQQVLESNENNNSTFKVFRVIDDLNADISISLASNQLSPDSDLVGTLNVYNPGNEFTGTVVLKITDSEGFPVGFEQTYDITNLNTGSAWEQHFTWNSADVFSGGYLAEATLMTENQVIVEQATAEFTISEFAAFDLLISAESQATFNTNVGLSVAVSYPFGNVSQSGDLLWELLDDNQQLVWSELQATGSMLPGFEATFEQLWLASAVGDFQLKVTLDTSTTSASAMMPLEVISTSDQLKLTGQIDELPAGVILGQPWNINYEIVNEGQISVTNVPVSLALWDSELSQLLRQENSSISLNTGNTTQLMNQWSSDNLDLGQYILVLTADLNAQGDSTSYLLDSMTIQTVDTTGPQINILNPLDLAYYPASIDVRAVVADDHAKVDSIVLSLDGNPVVTLPGQTLNESYQHWLTELSEGAHQLMLTAWDEYGNDNSETVNFVVDSASPVINVTGVEGDGLYNQTVQANISITEANLSTSQVILNGVPYTSGSDITSEGSYVLIASATDLAGNSTVERLFFNIDLTPPSVFITYPINGSETNQTNTQVTGTTEVSASLTLSNGAFSDVISADLEGNFSFVDVPLTSGVNNLSVVATDLAGNVGAATGVSIELVEDIDVTGAITASSTHPLGQDYSVAWQITNLNNFPVTQLPSEVNVYQVSDNQLVGTVAQNIDLAAADLFSDNSVFDTAGLSPGDHRIELRVEIDQLWQTLDDHLVDLQDVVGPEISVVSPVAGQLTNATVDLLVLANDTHSQVTEVSYQLDGDVTWIPLSWNGAEYVGQLNLANGDHQIMFRATDSFNNESTSNNIAFIVDAIGPAIDVTSPIDGLITNQDVSIEFVVNDDHNFNVDAQLNLASINNGHVVSSEDEYELVITATDEVNNETTVTRNFIIDTTAPTLVVTTPASDIQNDTGLLDVVGEAEELNTITIALNGDESTVKTDALGQFTASDLPLQVGMNVLVVTASDQAGNVSLPVTRNIEYIEVGSIDGRVWQDDDQDATIGGGELGFNQVALRLTDASNGTQDITTDAAGFYQISDLTPGQYSLEVVETELLTEWNLTTNNNPSVVDVVANQSQTINFGFYQNKPEIDANVTANNIKGRLLVLVDPPTAQVDTNQCNGVSNYQLQRHIEHGWSPGDSVTARLYDSLDNILQTESATYEDFINNGIQSIDQQAETNDFNLILHPVKNNHLSASVLSSSSSNPTVIPTAYRLELNLQTSESTQTWSSDLISESCLLFTSIGQASGDLHLADVGVVPAVPSDDPNGSVQVPYLVSQQVQLENILTGAGWSYEITSDVIAFESELATGQFVAYWLMAENVSLPVHVQTSLINAVDAGAGLVVSSGHDNLSAQFYSSMGIAVSGEHLSAESFVLNNSPIAGPATLDIDYGEQVLNVSLAGAQSAGVFTGVGILPPNDEAVTWHDGIDGSSVFSAIDWLLQATESSSMNHYLTLIQNVLTHIHPLGLSNELGYARAVKLSMQNNGRAVNGNIQVLLPPSVTLAHAEVHVMPNQDGFTFDYSLAEKQELEYEFWLLVNDSPTTVTFDIHLIDEASVFESLDLILVAGERPDLVTSFSNCEAGIKPNQAVTYQFDIINIGNKDITTAEAYTDFPTGLSNPSWTCTAASGATCPQISGSGDLLGENINLPVGASVRFTFESLVTAPVSSAVMPNAHVLMPQGISDVNPGNNEAADFDTVYQYLFKTPFECAAAGLTEVNPKAVVAVKEGL